MREMLKFCLAVLLAAVFVPATAQNTGQALQESYFLDQPDSRKFAVIVTGAAASNEIGARFRRWSFSLYDTLIGSYGYEAGNISLLLGGGEADRDGEGADHRVMGSSRRDDIEAAFEALSGEVAAGDQVTVFLIGHGTSSTTQDTTDAKFNIVGPDITGNEFAQFLVGLEQQNLVIINTTSSSFGFSAALSAEGRVVVSATRSPAEKFDPLFAEHFIAGLQEHRADRDKNNRVSVLEAFNYARQNVDAWYDEQGRLASEHAVIDDNGDALFSMEAKPTEGDGRLAEIAYLDHVTPGLEKTSPEARTLAARMQELERSVFLLRGRKAEFLEEEYWDRMEELLIDLAITTGKYNELP